ncbi:MAG: hypothetical protein JKX98_06115, partial [Alcanivoracaceae bacterium]|nr:hypothetical protein [Alcanivoracaceae bacterium]
MKKQFHKSFEFLDWQFDSKYFQLSLSYRLQNVGKVTEVLSFPAFDIGLFTQRKALIDKACELVHLMCGVSYYKAGLAEKIQFKHKEPAQSISQF